LDCAQDHFEHAVDILEDIVIPESKHLESSLAQAFVTVVIVSDSVGMLAAVEFDDEFLLEASEVKDVVPVGVLPAELGAGQLATAQVLPE